MNVHEREFFCLSRTCLRMRYEIHDSIRIKEEMVRAYLKVLTQQSNGQTKKNHD
jgi:hypothetical protein